MGEPRRKASLDLDRKTQIDVEQALTLESLALEEFRLLKEKKQASQKLVQSQNLLRRQSQQSTSSWQEMSRGIGTRKSSVDEQKIEPRSRPRPGSLQTGAGSSILAPPPAASRRYNNNASQSGGDQSDLISFSSPSEGKRKSLDQSIHFDELCSRLASPTTDPGQSSSMKILNNVGSASNPALLLSSSVQLQPDLAGSISHSVSENSSIKPTFPSFGNISKCLSWKQPLSMSAPASTGTTPTQTNVPYQRPCESRQQVSPQRDTFSSSLDVLKVFETRPNSNLIDLTSGPPTNVRASVLEAFDPLLSGSNSETVYSVENGSSYQTSNSVYDPYDPFDPFDFMYSPSEGSQSDPVYAAVVKKERPPPDSPAATSPPPLPPRNYAKKTTTTDREKSARKSLLKDITATDQIGPVYSSDLRAFHEMVLALRSEYLWDDASTNVGLVTSATIDSSYEKNTEIKLVVYPSNSVGGLDAQPVTFTCDVTSTVEIVILHAVCELEGDASGDANDYALRVWGLSEYLAPQTALADYEYIHNCVKLEQDVQLAVVRLAEIDRPLARTAQDDVRDGTLTIEDLLPNDPVTPISYDTLHILLETLEKELNRLQGFTSGLQTRNVVQAVKAVCALLGSIETSSVTEALESLVGLCTSLQVQSPLLHECESQPQRPEIVAEDGDYSMVALRRRVTSDIAASPCAASLSSHCERVRDAVERLIESYCRTFRVNFDLKPDQGLCPGSRCISSMRDSLLIHVDGLHRLLPKWEHEEFLIAGQVYHGTRPVGPTVVSQFTAPGMSFYRRVMFNCWLDFGSLSMSLLPREARVVLVLYGLIHTKPNENGATSDPTNGEEPTKEELGWTALQLFDYEGVLAQGGYLLALWPCEADKRWGPAPPTGIHPHGNTHPVLGIELPDFGVQVIFPEPDLASSVAPTYDFDSLDNNTQQQLLSIIENDSFTRPPPEDREVLWEKRYYLHQHPEALGKVILAARSWEVAPRADLHALLHSWTPLTPVQALQLLLPCFPDAEVRRAAVGWISDLSSDELLDFLPQLVQVLKHETYLTCPLAALLFRRSLTSPRVAHHLYWLLTQGLPGTFPQNSGLEVQILVSDDHGLAAARHQSRLQLMLRALLAITGDALRRRFLSQQLLVKNFLDVAENVKSTKEPLRTNTLTRDLERVQHVLEEIGPTCLPLSPALEVCGIHVRSCSYFPSNTLPLKISFEGVQGGITPAIFKVGDDLQQDMLTIQMIRIMDKLWLKEGLDLKMVTFACVPTGDKRGMIEMVQDAETLRRIQVELGVAGSFKDRPIAEWLAKHNPSALEYERAVHNFTASCAGYSVATYILGICDRHNDNIMLKTSGHLFHIDFGKFLGDAQMFGNFKRDRVPFVLSSDMAYVINGGDKPSKKFQHFVDLCCQAFNIIRNHGNLILNLFGMMASSGIPGVTMDAVSYVQSALLPDLSNPVAAACFTRMIQSSLKSWFTSFNFFLHNLAQLRFSPDHSDGKLLSFIPKTYTMQQEGRIKNAVVFGVQKRYDPEKYYVYILRVERHNQMDPTYLFRSYKEFCEFQQKLCIHFPLAKCHSLPTKMRVGRSNIKQVAEKRRADIDRFLSTLFQMADEIAHSDLVYTFFHPLLRDQQEASIHATKLKERKSAKRNAIESHLIKGQLRLSLHYQRGTLMVMVHHARDLPTVAGGQEPSSYVKVYLLPDPSKVTKRKTKVVRRSCHPVFMEMLEYRMSLDVVQRRVLQATVWNQDKLQENEFLGGVSLPLENVELCGPSETVEWYSLGNVHR